MAPRERLVAVADNSCAPKRPAAYPHATGNACIEGVPSVPCPEGWRTPSHLGRAGVAKPLDAL